MLNRKLKITDIPEDVLITIFASKYLIPKDLAAIVLVCKQWSRLAMDADLWKKAIKKSKKTPDLYHALVEEIRGNGNSKLILRYCSIGANTNVLLKDEKNSNIIEKKYGFRDLRYGFFKQASLLSLAGNSAEYSHQIDNIKTLLAHGADPMIPASFIEYKGEVAGGHIYYNLTERVLYEKPVDSAINKHVKAILLLEMIKIARKNNRPINEIENLDDQYRKLQRRNCCIM